MKKYHCQNGSGIIEYYKLQDKILNLVFGLKHSFYLTGGTALHRFYYNYRLSDDLDFFTNNDLLFHEYVNNIFSEFKKDFDFQLVINEKDFVRINIANRLKVDFVNDIAYRYGKSKIIKGFKIDNVINILTNKIGAIIGRDSEKDIFDLIAICFNEDFNWDEIINIAKKKMHFETEFLIYRLKTFPFEWLTNLKILKPLNFSKKEIEIIIKDILSGADNSLHKGDNKWVDY
jgi:predicted nucleotidyltransferase component of viral defense system